MLNFALKRIEAVKGPIAFFKLEIDGKCELDIFFSKLENRGRKKEVMALFATMDSLANGFRLPPSKHKLLKGRDKNDYVPDFEIKRGEIRLYYFEISYGKIIVFGSVKNKIKGQRKDIDRLRAIKVQYLNSIGYGNER